MDTHELKVLFVSEGFMEANIIKARLESFNIPCVLRFESVGRLYGVTMDGLGKVQVMVPADYIAPAREILESADGAEDPEEDATEPEP